MSIVSNAKEIKVIGVSIKPHHCFGLSFRYFYPDPNYSLTWQRAGLTDSWGTDQHLFRVVNYGAQRIPS